MPTHVSWRAAVAALRQATGPTTNKQRNLAADAGTKLPRALPQFVAAARLQAAYAAELCVEPPTATPDYELEYLATLDAKRARDPRVKADRREAEAWIKFLLFKRRQEALERLQLEAGDIVEIKRSAGQLGAVASIGGTGRIYFKGGSGAGAWPDMVTVKCRGTATTKKAEALKAAAANQAATRAKADAWSVAKEKELLDYKIMARVRSSDIDQLEAVIHAAEDEKPIQMFLEKCPQTMAALLGGSPRFVVPRPNLGGKRIPDFLLGDVDSLGIRWILVELETPVSPVTLQNDNLLEKPARKGESQIEEWREWIQNNLSLARRSRRDGGLGLPDIRPRSEGLVLVGRRTALGENASDVRNPIHEQKRIRIHTYDWLLEQLRGALDYGGPSGVNPFLMQPLRDDDGNATGWDDF